MNNKCQFSYFTDYLNSAFVIFLLNLMEVPPSDLEVDEIIEMCTKLLLVFNLQFNDYNENIILKGIVERQAANVFVRQLIDMLNRHGIVQWRPSNFFYLFLLFICWIKVLKMNFCFKEDPISDISKHEPKPLNTVLRMLLDLTYDIATARTIYTNDLKVLIEIIARELSNATSRGNVNMLSIFFSSCTLFSYILLTHPFFNLFIFKINRNVKNFFV